MASRYFIAPPLVGPGVRAISAVIDTEAADWFPLLSHMCEIATWSFPGFSKIFNISGLQIFGAELHQNRASLRLTNRNPPLGKRGCHHEPIIS